MKNQPPKLNTNYFSKEKLLHHIQKKEKEKFNTLKVNPHAQLAESNRQADGIAVVAALFW